MRYSAIFLRMPYRPRQDRYSSSPRRTPVGYRHATTFRRDVRHRSRTACRISSSSRCRRCFRCRCRCSAQRPWASATAFSIPPTSRSSMRASTQAAGLCVFDARRRRQPGLCAGAHCQLRPGRCVRVADRTVRHRYRRTHRAGRTRDAARDSNRSAATTLTRIRSAAAVACSCVNFFRLCGDRQPSSTCGARWSRASPDEAAGYDGPRYRGPQGAGLRGEQGTRPRLRAGARRKRAPTSRSSRAPRTRCAARRRRSARAPAARRLGRVRHHDRRRAARPRCAACPSPDILVNNAGGPPPGDFRDFDRDDWIRALDANMLTPIELIKATVDDMIARRFGRIVNITSSAVKAPIDMLGLSNGARSGLTGFVAGLARKRRAPQRHDQQPAARDRSTPIAFARRCTRRAQGARASRLEALRCRRRATRFPRVASACRPSSAPCARSCAARTRATSSARTS